MRRARTYAFLTGACLIADLSSMYFVNERYRSPKPESTYSVSTPREFVRSFERDLLDLIERNSR